MGRRHVAAAAGVLTVAGLWSGPPAAASAQPTVRVVAADEVVEGRVVDVSVVLSAVSSRDVTVRVDTMAGTALAPDDYRGVHRRVTVPAGERSVRLRLRTAGDALDERAEDFLVRLSRPRGAELSSRRASARVVVRDDDPLPRVRIEAATFTEPVLGHRLGFTQVRLSAPSGRRVVVDLRTREGTAEAGRDFVPLRPVAVFEPGATAARVSVELLSDDRVESAETLRLAVTGVRHARSTGGATITILDAAGGRHTPSSG